MTTKNLERKTCDYHQGNHCMSVFQKGLRLEVTMATQIHIMENKK